MTPRTTSQTRRDARRGLWRDQRGQELIEFALAAIMFFMVIFGILEFGRAIWQRNVLAVAVKDGARWAAPRGFTASSATCANCGGPCTSNYATLCQATQLSVSGYVLTQTFGLAPTVTFTCGATPTNAACANANMGAGMPLMVKASMPFVPLVTFLKFATSGITLQSSAQMTFAQ